MDSQLNCGGWTPTTLNPQPDPHLNALQERYELDIKIHHVIQYMRSVSGEREHSLLSSQLEAMQNYSRTLTAVMIYWGARDV